MATFFANHLSGNKRWAGGQLENLPGERQEEQGEKEQVFPQAPESKDGTEGMMLFKLDFIHFTVIKNPVLCILTSASAGSCVVVITQSSGYLSYCKLAHPDPDKRSFVLGFSNVYICDLHPEIIPASCKKKRNDASSTSVTDEKCGFVVFF